MSALTDLLLNSTDPVVAILLVVIVGYMRLIEREIRRDMREVRERTQLLEQRMMDGEEPAD